MKSATWNELVLAEHRAYLRDNAAIEAFDVLVAVAIELPGYRTEPVWQPPKRSFNYDDTASGERPFAFIVNRGDILFYVRSAGRSRVSGGFDELKKQFSSSDINPSGEWTVHIASKHDAERLNSFLFSYSAAKDDGGIPDGITREDIIAAINRLDSGETHQFAESVKYDLVYEERHYAPKAVIGLAAERLAGRRLGPYDFKGGEESKCFRILRQLQFVIEPKSGEIGSIDRKREMSFPDELGPNRKYIEGAKTQVWVNAYERNSKGRTACLSHYGFNCAVCDCNFEDRYGERGKDFIHVHHLKPISLTDGLYMLDPVADLRPVCPNCHAMLHRGEDVLSIEELRSRLK